MEPVRRPPGDSARARAGDFYQLQPVLGKRDLERSGGRVYAFQTSVWKALAPVQLTEIVRQKDARFAGVLNRIRVGDATQDDIRYLRQNTTHLLPGREAIASIFPSNPRCHSRNQLMMARLPGEQASCAASRFCLLVGDDDGPAQRVDEHALPREPYYPRPGRFQDVLALKEDSRVVCTKNIYGHGPESGEWTLIVANGSKGTVLSLEGLANGRFRSARVRFDALGPGAPEFDHEMEPVCFSRRQRFRFEGKRVRAVLKQIPLKVAFACTTHSSQGGTVATTVDIDPASCAHRTLAAKLALTDAPRAQVGWTKDSLDRWIPAPAMVYVSLSRATALPNIRLLGNSLSLDKIKVDSRVKEYYRRVFG